MGAVKDIISPSKPKISVPPVVDRAAVEDEERKKTQEELDQKRKRQAGRASTLLTSGQGVVGDDSFGLATRTLLGI